MSLRRLSALKLLISDQQFQVQPDLAHVLGLIIDQLTMSPDQRLEFLYGLALKVVADVNVFAGQQECRFFQSRDIMLDQRSLSDSPRPIENGDLSRSNHCLQAAE